MSHKIKIFVQQIYCRFRNCLLKVVWFFSYLFKKQVETTESVLRVGKKVKIGKKHWHIDSAYFQYFCDQEIPSWSCEKRSLQIDLEERGRYCKMNWELNWSFELFDKGELEKDEKRSEMIVTEKSVNFLNQSKFILRSIKIVLFWRWLFLVRSVRRRSRAAFRSEDCWWIDAFVRWTESFKF